MRSLLKQLANRSKSAVIVFKIYDNWRLRKQLRSGNIETLHGATHGRKTVTESLDYISNQFNDYLTYSGLNSDEISGKRVLELGFGDNLGVALRFIAAGATRVVCLDRFYSQRNPEHQIEIYKALRETLSEPEKARFDSVINLQRGMELKTETRLAPDSPAAIRGLKCIYGMNLEDAAEDLTRRGEIFDLIVSRAVLEEIYDPQSTFSAMNVLLASGGFLLHKIDLGDYGIFCDRGMHPLTFLTISESVYRLMATDSGIPNRKRIGYYRELMQKLGYETKFFVTSIIAQGSLEPHKEKPELNVDYSQSTLKLISAIRPKLSSEFRSLPDEDLLVDGIFLVAKKP